MPRMESLPESSQPLGDIVKSDQEALNIYELVAELPESDPRNQLTWSDVGIVLSIPLVGGLAIFGLVYLYNPASISWLAPSAEAPAFYSDSLWNLPKSIPQIQSELERSQLKLGENYGLKTGEILYTVLETETQNIREIRIYQPVRERTEEKLLLVSTTTVAGVDEYFVRSPKLKYLTEPIPARLRPNRNRLPLKKLSLINNPPSQFDGIWFTTSGNIDGIAYGQIYYFAIGKRSQLMELEQWTSPAGELPQWRKLLSTSQTQLVVNQSQGFEPSFLIFHPEDISADSVRKMQLRQSNLNEAKGQPKSYQQALVMASVGLWSPAMAKFDQALTELRSQKQAISPFLQEQYELIAFHAQITTQQTQQAISNLGDKALVNIIDGQWQEAIAIANNPAYKGDRIAEMLRKYHPHIWQRVMTMLTMSSDQNIKLWGGLVVLHREGLRRAETWLRSQKVNPKDFDPLLQRLDLAPITIQPRQLLGTVAHIGKNAGNDWFLPPPKLEPNQAWYEVSIDLIKDGDLWRNAPFSELSDRSSTLLWRTLGLSLNNNLGVVTYDAYGKSQAWSLTAESLWVSADGRLKVLASGEASLLPLLNRSILTPLVTSGGAFNPPDGITVDWQTLSPSTIERIIRSMYRELQRNGQVSLSIEEFSLLVQEQWRLSAVDLDGFGKLEYLLLLDREQVDLQDRHYPVAIAFSSDGALLFSDISGGRIWMGILPSSQKGQILTFRNGQYEMWNFR